MYKEMLNKLEVIKDKFVDIEVIDNIFEAEGWDCMGWGGKMNKIFYVEGPMDREIDLAVELNKPCTIDDIEAIYENEDIKVKILEINKRFW